MRSLLVLLVLLLTVPALAEEGALGIRPVLGVQTDASDSPAGGLRVDAVMPGSIAERMGIAAGDRLISLNGRQMRVVGDIRGVLEGLHRGDTLKAVFVHEGKQLERDDSLGDVPVLPTYEVVEAVGIPGVASIGDTREAVEKALGKAPGEIERDGVVFLGYPSMGLTVAFMPAPKELRLVMLRVQYPFVGRTRKGVPTTGARDEVLEAYAAEGLVAGAPAPNGACVDVVGKAGVRFVSLNGRIVEVHVLPRSVPPP